MASDRSAADVLGVLSDETRVDILRAVALAECGDDPGDDALAGQSFSDIYEAVDVENTSKFSYHLGELTGAFLRKGEGGYSLTHAGERIARLLLAENYAPVPEFEPRETDGTCPFCGESPLEIRRHTGFLLVECPACDRPVANAAVTPAQVRTRAGEELVCDVARSLASDYDRVRRGNCPACGGRLDTEVREPAESPLPDADPFLAVDRCVACARLYNVPLTYRVAYHPASVAFHWERGVDVTARALWQFHEHLYDGRWTAERVATDPDSYEVVLRRDGDALRCRLDAAATVTRTERVRRG